MLLGHNDRKKSNQRIPVDLRSVREYDGAAVSVTVKDHTEVRVVLNRRASRRVHRLLVLRVRDVVRKCPVRIKEDASRRVRAERLQNVLRKEACRSVSRVLDDMKALKRMLVVVCAHGILDDLSHVLAVERDEIEGLRLRISGSRILSCDRRIVN